MLSYMVVWKKAFDFGVDSFVVWEFIVLVKYVVSLFDYVEFESEFLENIDMVFFEFDYLSLG